MYVSLFQGCFQLAIEHRRRAPNYWCAFTRYVFERALEFECLETGANLLKLLCVTGMSRARAGLVWCRQLPEHALAKAQTCCSGTQDLR